MEVGEVDPQSIAGSANLADPFHEISVNLVLSRQLQILSASGSMGRIPYANGCPQSLDGLSRLVGRSAHPGFARQAKQILGGPAGCPYVLDLVVQLVKFLVVCLKSEEAVELMVARDDLEGFKALRRDEMGECAGHTHAGEDQLPSWLELLRQESAAVRKPGNENGGGGKGR